MAKKTKKVEAEEPQITLEEQKKMLETFVTQEILLLHKMVDWYPVFKENEDFAEVYTKFKETMLNLLNKID
jgi:hypothetical protein